MNYANICLLIIILTLSVYILSDGKALALCLLLPFITAKQQARVFNSILPSWDANQTWLVFTLAALYGAFSSFFGQIFSHLYLPLITLLLLFILRGAAIEFSLKEYQYRHLWYALLAISSLSILLMQSGVVAFLILQQQLAEVNLQLTPVQHVTYYSLSIATLLIFHVSQALEHVECRKKVFQPRNTLLLLTTLFTANLLYFDSITGFYLSYYWFAHLLMITLLFASGFLLEKSLKKGCVQCFCLNLAIVTFVMVVLYLFPFYTLHGTSSLIAAASSHTTVKVICIASVIILPCLFISMKLLQRIFQNTTDAISY